MKNKIAIFFSSVGKWIRNAFKKIGKFFHDAFKIHDGKEPNFHTFCKLPSSRSVISALICIFAGVVVGALFMIVLSFFSEGTTPVVDALYGFVIMLLGPFSSGSADIVLTGFGNMLFFSAPLILTGLSIAIAFKTGLFNIGAPGQYFMGVLGSLLVALNIDCTGSPVAGFFVWLLSVLAGIVCGALWGCIPGIFKSLLNVNEVIVCIMTNWIAANVVSWVFGSQGLSHLVNSANGKSAYLVTTSTTGAGTPTLGLGKLFGGSYLDISIFIAIAMAIVIKIVLDKTTFGYELKACGLNKDAAKYAGMSEKRNVILSMAIAGALAGLGGCLYHLNPGIELSYKSAYQTLPSQAFNGIPVALLASNNPIGVIFTGILLRYLNEGGGNLVFAGFNMYIADIVIALIIYFAGFSKLIRDYVVAKQNKRADKYQQVIADSQTAQEDLQPTKEE